MLPHSAPSTVASTPLLVEAARPGWREPPAEVTAGLERIPGIGLPEWAWTVVLRYLFSADEATVLETVGVLTCTCHAAETEAGADAIWKWLCDLRGWSAHLSQTHFLSVISDHPDPNIKADLQLDEPVTELFSYQELYRARHTWRCEVCSSTTTGAPYLDVLTNEKTCLECLLEFDLEGRDRFIDLGFACRPGQTKIPPERMWDPETGKNLPNDKAVYKDETFLWLRAHHCCWKFAECDHDGDCGACEGREDGHKCTVNIKWPFMHAKGATNAWRRHYKSECNGIPPDGHGDWCYNPFEELGSTDDESQ